MTKGRLWAVLTRTLNSAVVALFTVSSIAAGDVPKMSKEELGGLLGKSDVLIVDLRRGKDWNASEFKIQGAVRQDGDDTSWAEAYSQDQTIVLYCACPNEFTSARMAQKLMDEGYTNVFALKGGWREWFRARYPVEER